MSQTNQSKNGTSFCVRFCRDLGQDLRYAWRSLGRTPGFALGAVLLLALGIGANTAVFSVLNAILVRPLPYPDSDRLVVPWVTESGLRMNIPLTAPDYYDWRERSRSFAELGVQTVDWANLSGAQQPERVRAFLSVRSCLR